MGADDRKGLLVLLGEGRKEFATGAILINSRVVSIGPFWTFQLKGPATMPILFFAAEKVRTSRLLIPGHPYDRKWQARL